MKISFFTIFNLLLSTHLNSNESSFFYTRRYMVNSVIFSDATNEERHCGIRTANDQYGFIQNIIVCSNSDVYFHVKKIKKLTPAIFTKQNIFPDIFRCEVINNFFFVNSKNVSKTCSVICFISDFNMSHLFNQKNYYFSLLALNLYISVIKSHFFVIKFQFNGFSLLSSSLNTLTPSKNFPNQKRNARVG